MAFKYRGKLAKRAPYDPKPSILLSDDATRAAWIERYVAGALERWRALYEAHGVEWGNESELLLRLAEAHVPGFTMQQRSGPNVEWGPIKKAEFRIAVDEYVAARKQQGKSASKVQACIQVAKLEPWKAMFRKGSGPREAPRNHYNTADDFWVTVVREARLIGKLIARGKPLEEIARIRSPGISRKKKTN